MKKVAIFVEGQGEQIFVRHLLNNLIGANQLSFECLCLRAGNLDKVPYTHKNEQAEVHFLIIINFVGLTYDKHFSEVESITSHITFDDIVEIIMSDDKRCESFKRFCNDLISY